MEKNVFLVLFYCYCIPDRSIRTILLSIKMITPSYTFTSLQLSKSQTSPPKYTGKCCSISHALIWLLHNLNRHYLLIRSQTNPVHISHSTYISALLHDQSLPACYKWSCWKLLRLQSTFNPTDIRNHPQILRPQKMKYSIRFLENILFFGSYKSSE